jgi:ABC-type branched-subunit amino acid transport system permease subunit
MKTSQRNLVLALSVLVGAVFLFIWGCPYLRLYSHEKLCIALYVVLLLVYFYGRASASRGSPPPRRFPPPPQ